MIHNPQHKFSFRYGRVKVRARLPRADWIRPAIWLMSENSSYGAFPASGEIDLMESSGNRDLRCGLQSRAVDTVQTNLHFGPPGSLRHWSSASVTTNTTMNYGEDFHIYEIEWREQYLAFIIGKSVN